MNYEITSSKGSHRATQLREICEWQSEYQGMFAEISEIGGATISVDDIDFGDIDSAIEEISHELSIS